MDQLVETLFRWLPIFAVCAAVGILLIFLPMGLASRFKRKDPPTIEYRMPGAEGHTGDVRAAMRGQILRQPDPDTGMIAYHRDKWPAPIGQPTDEMLGEDVLRNIQSHRRSS